MMYGRSTAPIKKREGVCGDERRTLRQRFPTVLVVRTTVNFTKRNLTFSLPSTLRALYTVRPSKFLIFLLIFIFIYQIRL